MKRTLLALSLLAGVLPGPAHAQSAGGYATESYEAHANWLAERSSRRAPLFRYISVMRDERVAGAADTMAQIGQARCTSHASRRSFFYRCTTEGRLIYLKRASFQFDAALRSARVDFRVAGRAHSVRWKGRDEQPDPSWSLQGGERSLVARVATTVGARVRGSVLGESFSSRRRKARATLRRSTEAGLLYEAPIRSFTVGGPTRAAAWRELRRQVGSL